MTDAGGPEAAHDPPPGVAQPVLPGVWRVLAPNPGPMTFRGTNTYVVGTGDAPVTVIDPGPAEAAHVRALLGAIADLSAGAGAEAILVTHAHLDHSAAAPDVAAATGAPVLAYGSAHAGRRHRGVDADEGGEGRDSGFVPDRALPNGADVVTAAGRLRALWTPGHFGNHMCFVRDDGTVFTGDLVMGWATSVISPPDGDLADFRDSLHRLSRIGARILLPGHGAPVGDPAARIAALLAHRAAREAQILAVLEARPAQVDEIAQAIYRDTPKPLRAAAARNVRAHLIDLETRGRVTRGRHGYATRPAAAR